MTEAQQTTLLRWAASHAADFAAPLDARRGAPTAYALHFGAYKGFTLPRLVRASKGGGSTSLLKDARSSTRMLRRRTGADAKTKTLAARVRATAGLATGMRSATSVAVNLMGWPSPMVICVGGCYVAMCIVWRGCESCGA